MKQVYPEPIPFAKRPARDFAAELDLLCRQKISEIVQIYLEAEVDELLQRVRYERSGHESAGYRDGHDPRRTITTGAGPITIARPRVRGIKHQSALIPPYRRRLPMVDKTMHKLYLEGLAHRDFEPALRALLGESAPLSPSTIARVNAEFQSEFAAWKKRRLDDEHYMYLWSDGIHLGAGPSDERRVLLVSIGADADGIKHLVALEDAKTESELSWSEVFADLKVRGMREPKLLIADGANGLWAAADAQFPNAKQQRCWLHKIRNVLDKVPKNHQRAVHAELRKIVKAETEREARAGIETLARALQRDYPKAAACIRDDVDRMVAYFRFPKANWKNIRTTNPIESISASVRLQTDAAKRLRSGASTTYLVYALIKRLSSSWRRLDGYQHIAVADQQAA